MSFAGSFQLSGRWRPSSRTESQLGMHTATSACTACWLEQAYHCDPQGQGTSVTNADNMPSCMDNRAPSCNTLWCCWGTCYTSSELWMPQGTEAHSPHLPESASWCTVVAMRWHRYVIKRQVARQGMHPISSVSTPRNVKIKIPFPLKKTTQAPTDAETATAPEHIHLDSKRRRTTSCSGLHRMLAGDNPGSQTRALGIRGM